MLPTMRYPASTSFCSSPDLYGTTDEPRDDGLQGTNTGDTQASVFCAGRVISALKVHGGSTAYGPEGPPRESMAKWTCLFLPFFFLFFPYNNILVCHVSTIYVTKSHRLYQVKLRVQLQSGGARNGPFCGALHGGVWAHLFGVGCMRRGAAHGSSCGHSFCVGQRMGAHAASLGVGYGACGAWACACVVTKTEGRTIRGVWGPHTP
jgi:hypothetical protein